MGLTLAVAESCTGGLVGHRLTGIAGSSAFFERGVVVYSNRAKQELLGVPEEILRVHGAVSRPCAEAMVRGICERAGAPCGLAITGIAGPDGGTPTKPVGTVFIGVAVYASIYFNNKATAYAAEAEAVPALKAQVTSIDEKIKAAPPSNVAITELTRHSGGRSLGRVDIPLHLAQGYRAFCA